ncbi:hypothetical protein PybrP1_006839 [[Pythium] brassicae (nom. inval.)]|nr:hypothetical protein PybrP1_006839 [[Pythium] brassicae (nom. inval.)]
MATQRVEQETRARLVREKFVAAQAETFWRQKQLPKWFFRWCSCVQATKDARELEAAQQKRKEQAQRLMERLLRQQVAPEDPPQLNDPHQQDVSCASAVEVPAPATARQTAERKAGKTRAARPQHKSVVDSSSSQHVNAKLATPVGEELKPSPEHFSIDAPPRADPPPAPSKTSALKGAAARACPPPAVDPLYASMQERAAERKQRRALLKQRYEQLEQEKRDAVAAQMSEVEAQVAQQKIDERARVRERKHQESLAAQAKALRLEHLDGQRRAARRHNYTRLTSHYGFLPLRRHWEHVRDVHAERQQAKHRQLQVAAKHHAQTLARSHRMMRRWKRAVALRHMQELAQVRRAVSQLAIATLRRVWIQWRVTTTELQEQRERQQEKERLWRKYVILPTPTFTVKTCEEQFNPLEFLEIQEFETTDDFAAYSRSKGYKTLRALMDDKTAYTTDIEQFQQLIAKNLHRTLGSYFLALVP